MTEGYGWVRSHRVASLCHLVGCARLPTLQTTDFGQMPWFCFDTFYFVGSSSPTALRGLTSIQDSRHGSNDLRHDVRCSSAKMGKSRDLVLASASACAGLRAGTLSDDIMPETGLIRRRGQACPAYALPQRELGERERANSTTESSGSTETGPITAEDVQGNKRNAFLTFRVPRGLFLVVSLSEQRFLSSDDSASALSRLSHPHGSHLPLAERQETAWWGCSLACRRSRCQTWLEWLR